MPTAQLTERIADWNRQLQVQNEERLVKNVALTGNSSRNGYQYDELALTEAVPLYNGKPVFLDHANNAQRPPSRSTRDLVGSVINPRLEAGRIRGDIRVVDTESGRTFLALVDAQTPGVGMSHVVLAERSPDGKRVERIRDVLSVDVVVNPATTSTFQESTCTLDFPIVDPSATQRGNLDEVVSHAAWEQLQAELNAIKADREQLLLEVVEFRSLQRQREIQQLLQESGLPAAATDGQFREQLASAATPADRQRLVQERQQLVRRLTVHAPHSAPRTSAASHDHATFIQAIKQRN